MGDTTSQSKTEAQLIEETREAGRAFLRRSPGAFGGGIDPQTGIRTIGGLRVSVAGTGEVAGVGGVPTLEQARIISAQAAVEQQLAAATESSRIEVQKAQESLRIAIETREAETIKEAARKQLRKVKRTTRMRLAAIISRKLKTEEKFMQIFKIKKEPIKAKDKKSIPKLISLSIIPLPSIGKIQKGVIRAIDFVSGGALTESRLNKRGDQINQDIENFNKKFGGRELSEVEFNKANAEAKSIADKEEALVKERDKLASSVKSKLAGFFGSPLEKRLTGKQAEEKVKQRLRSKQKELKKINTRIQKREKKKFNIPALDRISKFKLKNLKSIRQGIKVDLGLLKKGQLPKIKVFAGTFPIIPAISIPSGVTAIKFLGRQRTAKGGKVITDLVFKTSRGRVGVARGVSVTKGKNTASVVLGRSGKVRFKFPSAKKKLTAVRSFIGREISVTKPGKFVIRTQVRLLQKSRRAGTIIKIKENIQALKQAGIGQVGSIRGKKFISITGKLKKVRVDDFASVSAIFTKKELSLIIGKSITRAGAKSEFIGLIKGTSKVTKAFSIGEKQQFKQALSRIISATSAALIQTKQISGLTKAQSLVVAARIAAKIPRAKPTPRRPIVKLRFKPKVIPKVIPITRVTPTVKTISGSAIRQITTVRQTVKTKTIQKASQKLVQLQKQEQKLAQKLSQRLTQRQLLNQRTRLIQVQKKINKLINRFGIPFIPGIGKIPRLPFLLKIKGKKIKKKKVRRKIMRRQAYSTFARPLRRTKKGRRPKLIRVSKVPLRKRRARDLRNFIVDTSLSRTARIKKTRGKIRKSKLKFPKGYAKRTARKFRRFKIVKGKRRRLPKGVVIEKRQHLLDTRQEIRKISLRRRIRQITRRPIKRRVVKKRNVPVRRIVKKMNGRRRAQLLANLMKARIEKARLANLRKRQDSSRRTRMRRIISTI